MTILLSHCFTFMYYTSKEVYEFISKQTNDPIVEWKTCVVSGQPFAIYQSDLDFYAKISPTFAGQKFHIPTPALCPEERQRRRLAFRNERKLYKRKCDFSGKDIISVYSPDKPYKVYDQKIWRSDERNPTDYEKYYDFSQSFTEQFETLLKNVPHTSLCSIEAENSDYTNFALNIRNCYLVFGGGHNENCMFCVMMSGGTNNLDCLSVFDCEECYQCTGCKRCYQCYQVADSNDCSNCILIDDSNGCKDCIMCCGLTNKQYYFLNEYVGPEIIKQLKNNINQLAKQQSEEHKKFSLLKNTQPKIQVHNLNSSNCYGEIIIDSNKCIDGFNINNCDNCKHISFLHNAEGSQDIDYASPYGANNSYNLCSSTGTSKSITTFLSRRNDHIYYSLFCFDCKNCFGCIGLRNKSYCIFNKQFTKEEYEVRAAKIIAHMQETGEWGEYFHPSLSPFGYNETVAQEYFPLTKEEAVTHGYKRSDYNADPIIPPGSKVVDRKNTTDEPANDQEILQSIFICEVSGRPFRIIKQELEFYRKHAIPLPRRHPDQRHADRMALRAPRELHLRTCDQCGQEMLSVYNKEYNSKVYCEKCYQKEIYS